jgi:hypothetical protein
MCAVSAFYAEFDPDFISIRTKAREVLQMEEDLMEIVRKYQPLHEKKRCVANDVFGTYCVDKR